MNSIIAAVRELYPNLEKWHTGGGCFALRHDSDDGGFILITACEDARIPADDATEVDVGRYARDGDSLGDVTTIVVAKLQEWIDTALDRARKPQTIADYFATRLGASPRDDSLNELPMASICGQDCVKAIDAAAALLLHVHAAFGKSGDVEPASLTAANLESEVAEITRRVIGVYWHG